MNILVKSTAILLLFAFKTVSADESQFDILAKLDTGPGNVKKFILEGLTNYPEMTDKSKN
jgi:hypothetical protein